MEESNFQIDDTQTIEIIDEKVIKDNKKKQSVSVKNDEEKTLINCLRNEKIIVRFVPKEGGLAGQNPKHVLYGGMAENAVKFFTVPRLSSGMLANILTDNEKDYLEHVMQLEPNSLSIYKKTDNYWNNFQVRITKQDNIFNLSDPEDYIRYKVLLANKDDIAPSLQMLQDKPKSTYRFVIISGNDENKINSEGINVTMKCYKEFGKVEDNLWLLKTVVELLDKKPLAPTVKLDYLHGKVNELIKTNPKMFLQTITDDFISSKALIKQGVESGAISYRGGFYYIKKDNVPMCNNNEEPTLTIAAKWLLAPKNQEHKFNVEGIIKSK